MKHATTIFMMLGDHPLFSKRSKYSFGQSKVKYLGYVISALGITTDPEKVVAMVQ